MNRFSGLSPTDRNLRPKGLPQVGLIALLMVEMCMIDGDKTLPITAHCTSPLSSPSFLIAKGSHANLIMSEIEFLQEIRNMRLVPQSGLIWPSIHYHQSSP